MAVRYCGFERYADEGYSRNASCAINLISTFLLLLAISFLCIFGHLK